MILLHKLVQSVPRGYVTDFVRARVKEHELESRLLQSRASHFEQLALLRQKRSRALLEKEMYQHANKLSFPSTASIPSGGRVEWETTATDNALCWTLDAHGKQVRLTLGVVDITSINTSRLLLLLWMWCLMVHKVLSTPNTCNLHTYVHVGMSMSSKAKSGFLRAGAHGINKAAC